MKVCPNCQSKNDDNCQFCVNCGQKIDQIPVQENPQINVQSVYDQQYAPQYNPGPAYQPIMDPYDHTAEFDPNDIAENKIYAMLPYLLSVAGIIIVMLMKKDSRYVEFHLRESIKLLIANTVLSLATLVLFWTLLVPFAGSIMITILFVIRIIAFVQVCQGKAKNLAIIRSISFLK